MPRLRRFLHLERPRAAADGDAAPDPGAGTAERFEGVETPGARPAAPSSSGARLDRFGPEPEPSIELVEVGGGAQPFTRCMRCGMDHGVFATACTGCGASLDTAEQREFNERLWARRQEEAAREVAASAERSEHEAHAQAELARARRAMGEELAREVGRRERARLGDEEWRLAGPDLGGAWRFLRGVLRRFGR